MFAEPVGDVITDHGYQEVIVPSMLPAEASPCRQIQLNQPKVTGWTLLGVEGKSSSSSVRELP